MSELTDTPSDAPASSPAPAPKPRAFAPTVFRKLKPLEALPKKVRETMTAAQVAEYKSILKHEADWGHLPPQVHVKLKGVDPKNVPDNAVEKHAKTRGTDPVHFAAAKAFHRWPMHQEMSLEAYDAALEQMLAEKHGN